MLVNVGGAPLAPGVAGGVPARLNGLPYVICAPGGTIVPGGDQAPGDQAPGHQAPGHAADFCVFCLPLLHGAVAVAPPPLPGPAGRVVVLAKVLTVAGLAGRRGPVANGARAPPA